MINMLEQYFNIKVNNKPPDIAKSVPKDELILFQKYIYTKTNIPDLYPYEHQAQAFKYIKEGHNVIMVAGTAAGKTLAVAVPIFTKLLRKEINKVMFLYPTIALLEDQQSVLLELGKLTGMEDKIGYIRGGMTRSQLISNLSKKIIVATPDAIYWFFRKNIKYNSVLIYGLCQVDEFVIDEAHIFSGLTIQNLKLFFERIEILQKKFMCKAFHIHILTATPREEIFSINHGKIINGRSKCRSVDVSFFNSSPKEKTIDYKNLIEKAIINEYKKVLVICNSAAMAHRLFFDIAGKISESENVFTPEQYLQFGRVKKSILENALRKFGVSDGTLEKLYSADMDEIRYKLEEFKEVEVQTDPQEVFNVFRDILMKYKGKVIQVLYFTFKKNLEENKDFSSPVSLKIILKNIERRSILLKKLITFILPKENYDINLEKDYFEWKDTFQDVFNILLDRLENDIDSSKIVHIHYPSLKIIDEIIGYMDPEIVEDIKKRFLEKFSFNKDSIINYKGSFPKKNNQYVYLKWLRSYFKEEYETIYSALKDVIKNDMDFCRQIEMNHIGFIENTEYPVIVYSGSMSKSSRDGLINLFDDLKKAVLISTSAVEVGVDFSADLLITEKCEAGSFLQRFGRVGRSSEDACCWVLVDGGLFSDLKDEIDSKEALLREDFSKIITRTFKNRVSLENSMLPESNYVLINRQLGLIGDILNKESHISQASISFADKIEQAQINLLYGLRGTMPSVGLKDEGVTKNVFQLLQFLSAQQLEAVDSEFEMAKAGTYFTSLIYEKRKYQVFVDVEKTLEEGKAVIILNKDNFDIIVGKRCCLTVYKQIKQYCRSIPNLIYPVLIYGDIYLMRKNLGDEEGTLEGVCDRYGEPLILPDQFCLIFPETQDIKNLENMKLSDIEEIYYDLDYKGKSPNGHDLVLLDNIQGACLALYKIVLSSK